MHPRSPPWKRVIACQGNVRPVALKTSDHAPEDSSKHADAPQARLPRLRIGIFRGSSSICLFCLGKRGTMQSRSSLIGVNVTSNPDLRDSCWTSTIGNYRRIHAAPRIGPMKSASGVFFASWNWSRASHRQSGQNAMVSLRAHRKATADLSTPLRSAQDDNRFVVVSKSPSTRLQRVFRVGDGRRQSGRNPQFWRSRLG